MKHFLYTAWPDHGVPKLSSAIVRFIRQQIRPAYGDSTAPMVVHCRYVRTYIYLKHTIHVSTVESVMNYYFCIHTLGFNSIRTF